MPAYVQRMSRNDDVMILSSISMRIASFPAWALLALLLGACSKDASQAPGASTPTQSATGPLEPLAPESANVLRAQLNAEGIPTEYAAHFVDGRLARIDEHREVAGTLLPGEYSFQGARLLHYRGTRLDAPTAVELRFDLQGALQSGAGPHVSEEHIAAIRNRAQLLRSHALARHATKVH